MNIPSYKIYLYLRKSRPNRDNKCPIYIRISLRNRKMEFPSGQYVFPENWDVNKQKIIRTKDAHSGNTMLATIKSDINQNISRLYVSQTEVSLDNIRKLLKGDYIRDTYTLISVAEEHNLTFEKQVGIKYSYGSYKNYKTTLKYLKEFVPMFSGKSDIPLSSVNYKFCEAYFTFLTTKKHCHTNGANKQLQRLKRLVNYAIRLGYIQSNPTTNYSLEFTPANKIALTMDEIHRLSDLVLYRQVLLEVRDIFLIQCFTGLPYSDIKRLSLEHISTSANGTIWIRMQRQKTGIGFSVPLLECALNILNKYIKDSKAYLPLLPVLSNQKMNENLKLIQELAGVTKNLTTHLARHTFATTITLSNGVPIETVSRMLGHTKLSTTQIYAKVLEHKIGEDMQVLDKRLRSI